MYVEKFIRCKTNLPVSKHREIFSLLVVEINSALIGTQLTALC